MKQTITETMEHFQLPRYAQLSDVGLYLEQTVKYINGILSPLGCMEITSSMIRNYVKMGLVSNPVKKQYYTHHIAHLIAITILKQVLPLEHIHTLFVRQQQAYSEEVAYNYFCMELENILYFRFGLKDFVEDIGETSSNEKEMLRSAVIAVSHIIFLNACFAHLTSEPDTTQP